MFEKLKKHLAYYISMVVTLVLGLVLIFLTRPNIPLQGLVILGTVLFYILWGILHHLLNHELSLRIVIEYLLIGALGLAILFFALSGGLI
jgi:hypothetical protein